MAHYSSDSELYGDLGECLREVLCDPENAARAQAVGTVIRLETVRPAARITFNLTADAEPEVHFGESELRPAAVITMDADAARGFFLGEVSLMGALSGGKMAAEGPVAPILRVVPLANLVAPRLREREGGPVVAEESVAGGPVEEAAGGEPAEQAPGGAEPLAGEGQAPEGEEPAEQAPGGAEPPAGEGQAPEGEEPAGESAGPAPQAGEDQS